MIPTVRHEHIVVDGMDIHYAAAGEGHPIVFLHGLGASGITWEENVGPLSERFAVYAPDIPGHGDSVKIGVNYTTEAGTSLTLGFLDAIGAESAALAGSSMGGLIALLTALQYPERVSHLVLINTAGFGREVAGYLRVMSLPFLGELLEGPTHRSAKAMMRLVFGPRKAYPEALFEELVRTRSLPGGRDAVLSSLRQGVDIFGVKRRYRLLSRLQELQMPLMIVWGALDPVFPPQHAYSAAEAVPDARFLFFPGAGHWPHMEEAERFNAEVTAFLLAEPTTGAAGRTT